MSTILIEQRRFIHRHQDQRRPYGSGRRYGAIRASDSPHFLTGTGLAQAHSFVCRCRRHNSGLVIEKR